MAQLQPTIADPIEQQNEEEHAHVQQHDDSWARPPPGAPLQPDKATTMELDVVMSPPQQPRVSRRDFSMEDLEVARALTGLRQASPNEKGGPNVTYSSYQPASSLPQQEPLLSLFTSQHPLLGNAINNSLSAYNVGKSYSGPFKSSVEYVERNIATPVASTVGTAGRISGVENGVRWWLERRRSNSQGNGESQMAPIPSFNAHKRRREDSEGDVEQGLPSQRSRAPSDISMGQGEYLPAYDSNRSPSYSSRDPYPVSDSGDHVQHSSPESSHFSNGTWQTRLILSTSGLGVAMSGESRRSLKYCLSWLRWANGRLGRLLYSLQTVLSEYEAAQRQATERSNGTPPDHYPVNHQPRDLQAISNQLAALKTECTKTLQSAMDVINKYAGGALPENARMLVRKHLTSLPQRFAFMASLQEKEEEVLRRNAEARRHSARQAGAAPSTDTSDLEVATPSSGENGSPSRDGGAHRSEQESVVLGARRVVVLAREGLDMMAQVSAVVDGTITSAEGWCERLGRRLSDDQVETQLHTRGEHSTEEAVPEQDHQSHESGSVMDVEKR